MHYLVVGFFATNKITTDLQQVCTKTAFLKPKKSKRSVPTTNGNGTLQRNTD